jgi:hypothetical protein
VLHGLTFRTRLSPPARTNSREKKIAGILRSAAMCASCPRRSTRNGSFATNSPSIPRASIAAKAGSNALLIIADSQLAFNRPDGVGDYIGGALLAFRCGRHCPP